MSNTGTYVWVDGQGVVKVSDRIPVVKKVHDWMRQMDPAGEQRRHYANLSQGDIRKEKAAI